MQYLANRFQKGKAAVAKYMTTNGRQRYVTLDNLVMAQADIIATQQTLGPETFLSFMCLCWEQKCIFCAIFACLAEADNHYH